MVSHRCKIVVREELSKLGIAYTHLELGMADLFEPLTAENREILRINLMRSGLELMDDKKSILIERIKNTVIDLIHYSDEIPNVNFSLYLSEQLDYDYTYLSNVFSAVKGMTIQQYVIIHKIEKVKELILYDELNLTEIAYKLHYSSVSHLSSQFKKVTGVTPSYFKQLKLKRGNNLESL